MDREEALKISPSSALSTGSCKTIWFKPHNGSSFVHWVPRTQFTSSGGSFYSVVEYWVCIGINPVILTSADDPNDEHGASCTPIAV